MSDTFPPEAATTLQTLIRSYLYKQYEDDDDLQTFVGAQNYLAQRWLDDFNKLNLPVWSALSGDLLDWVGWGLYGIRRPILSYQKPAPTGAGSGPYNTMAYNTSVYGGGRLHPANTNPISYIPVTDDIYKRILTWHLYSGDGFQFSTPWLKRRVHRFMNGANGYLGVEDNTYDVSVTTTGPAAITITVTENEIGPVFQYAALDGFLVMPFQFAITIDPSLISFPNAGGGRLSAFAGFAGNAIVRGSSIYGGIDAAASISGSIDVLAGDRLLAGEIDAAASIAGDAVILSASGIVTWPVSGTLGAAAGISTGQIIVVRAMGGILAASAG